MIHYLPDGIILTDEEGAAPSLTQYAQRKNLCNV